MTKAIDGNYLTEDMNSLTCILCGKTLKWDFDLEGCGTAECCRRRYDSYVTNRVYSSNVDNV